MGGFVKNAGKMLYPTLSYRETTPILQSSNKVSNPKRLSHPRFLAKWAQKPNMNVQEKASETTFLLSGLEEASCRQAEALAR